MMKQRSKRIGSGLLAVLILALMMPAAVSCAPSTADYTATIVIDEQVVSAAEDDEGTSAGAASSEDAEGAEDTSTAEEETSADTGTASSFSLDDVPEYSDSPYAVVNGNVPFFSEEEITSAATDVFESYSALDELGRCGAAYANVCEELMPTEDRESISSVYPSGWVQAVCEDNDTGYLYDRCHLIAFMLAGENANELNLITGTRYMNVEGMLPFEELVADYVYDTGGHVLYRVTPVFDGDDLVAAGVLMEAYSVEDDGTAVCFCVFCYNVQPGVTIDYATGDSVSIRQESSLLAGDEEEDGEEEVITYVLNTSSMKFHLEDCTAVSQMSDNNKDTYTGTRSEVIAMGYDPCGICCP